MDPDDVLGLVVPALVLMGFGAAVAAGIALVQSARRGQTLSLPLPTLFRIYLAIMTGVSLLLLVGGLAHLTNAGISTVAGRDFSYRAEYVDINFVRPDAPASTPAPKPAPTSGEVEPAPLAPAPVPVATATPEEEEALETEGLKRAWQEGLLSGISFTVVGALLFGAHVWGKRRLFRVEEGDGNDSAALLDRLYLLFILLVFSIVTVSSLPSAAYEALRFYLLESDNYRNAPGDRLATAIVALPIWLLYLRGTIQNVRGQ